MADHHTLLGSIAHTLREAGLPLADQGGRATAGAVLSSHAHGVTVSWRSGPQGGTVEPAGAGAGGGGADASARARGAATIHSRDFRLTLCLAALLAEAGYQSEHAGDRVLVSNPAGR
ncbi:hypothetical protein OG455_03720 [Kitasatospora sp. NBC_01287]|uniref:hypothetical protein n=1 Tax=Kitasatospora sp. NBC_01287 TaxID=2903573 RepID=UPI0022552B9F|nr:hypothetical protein [Kitasatospora sp. NBC_01287]MCX4744638.1 hypothetical protein [Kitasatospora sp. NBC_01287]